MFYYFYPAEEEDTAVLLTNEEFFGVLQEKSEEYLQKYAEDREEVTELLKDADEEALRFIRSFLKEA